MMDPTEALTNLLKALKVLEIRHTELLADERDANLENEREEAVDCLLGLAGWIRGCGSPPDVDQAILDAGYYNLPLGNNP